MLSVVARRLQGRLRGYDVLGRWGGEEFIVLAPGVPDDATLLSLAEQIRRLVGELPVAIDEETLLPVTVSVGAVRAGDALRSVEGLVDCANRALAAAKRLGRDRVQLFGDLTVEDLVAEEPEPHPAGARARARVERALRPAAGRCGARLGSRGRDRRADAPREAAVTAAAGSGDCYTTLALLRYPIAFSRSSGRPRRATGSSTRVTPRPASGSCAAWRVSARSPRSWARTRSASTAPAIQLG